MTRSALRSTDSTDLGGLNLFTPQIEALFRQQIGRLVGPRTQAERDQQRMRQIADDLLRQQRAQRLAAEAALRAQIEVAIRGFASQLTFALEIPGRHYSGLSNQALFDIMAEQGRNFAATTRPLRDHVQQVLLDTFVQRGERFGVLSMRQYAADAILEWVVARFDGEQTDVSMRPLSQRWLDYKRKHGMPSRIGVANGDLADAVRESGRVVIS